MGPWKQIFDDGLETRKTAFETMYTLVSLSAGVEMGWDGRAVTDALVGLMCVLCVQLDTCLSRLDIPTYLARVVAGLADAPEIKGSSSLIF